jgi:hypothetical protein
MAENVVQNLSSPPTPEVGPVEYSNNSWQLLAEAASAGLDFFAMAKMSENLEGVEAQTENYYETSLKIFDKIETAPDMKIQGQFRKELEALQAGEVQGIMKVAAVDARQDAMARDYKSRFPHLEKQIDSMMSAVRTGSSGRAKQEQMVDDPYIEYRKRMFGVSAETNIPIPYLKDMAQRERIREFMLAELNYKKSLGENMEGQAFALGQNIAAGVADRLWDVISQDASGNKIGSPSYNTAEGRQQLAAASQQGKMNVLNQLKARLDELDVPVTKALLESVIARWNEGVAELETIVDNGNNYQVIDQQSKIKDIVALDQMAGGNNHMRLILKNPDIYNVMANISAEARRAFTFNSDGTMTPKEGGFPALVARGKAGDPAANIMMSWFTGDGKLVPQVAMDFEKIFLDGTPPENPWDPRHPMHAVEVMDSQLKLEKALKSASTPESLANVISGVLLHEPDKRLLIKDPEILLNPTYTIRSKALDNPAFMQTEPGQKTADRIVGVFSDHAATTVLRNPGIGDITEISITGPPEAPFVWHGAPNLVLEKPTPGTPESSLQGLPGRPTTVDHGRDAVNYLNSAYRAIKSFDPQRAKVFVDDAEREMKKEVRRRAEAIRASTPEETVITLTDEDFAEFVEAEKRKQE